MIPGTLAYQDCMDYAINRADATPPSAGCRHWALPGRSRSPLGGQIQDMSRGRGALNGSASRQPAFAGVPGVGRVSKGVSEAVYALPENRVQMLFGKGY